MRRSLSILLAASMLVHIGTAAAPGQTGGETLRLPQAGALPEQLAMASAAIVGDRVYYFGGRDTNGWRRKVLSSQVSRDAKLGSWREEAPLPELRAHSHNCVEVIGNRIYIAGGSTARTPADPSADMVGTKTVLWCNVNQDGTLGQWTVSAPMPGPSRYAASTCSADNRLFVTGGHENHVNLDSVLVADIASDGAVANWRTAGKMPAALSDHSSAIVGNRMFVWGGTLVGADYSKINRKVVSAEVGPDGTLGNWRDEAPVPEPVMAGPRVAHQNVIMTIGGRYNDNLPTNTIWFAVVDGGRITGWQYRKTDLEARLFHAVAVDRTLGRILILGGRNQVTSEWASGKPVDNVQAFQL